MNMDIKLFNGELWFADKKVVLFEPMIGDRLRHTLFVVRSAGDYPTFICGLDVTDGQSNFWLGIGRLRYKNFSEVKAILDEAHPDGWHVYEEDYSIIANLKGFINPEDNAKYAIDLWDGVDDDYE